MTHIFWRKDRDTIRAWTKEHDAYGQFEVLSIDEWKAFQNIAVRFGIIFEEMTD